MKNLNLINSKILVLIILIASCCEDKNPIDPMIGYPKSLRPITTTGDNVLACKVNGKLWESYVGINLSGYNSFRMGYDSLSGHFGINAQWIIDDIFEKIGFVIQVRPEVKGEYKLVFDNGSSSNYLTFNPGFSQHWVDTNQLNYVKIINYNKDKKIISGTFEFSALSATLKDTFHITEGRFDGTY